MTKARTRRTPLLHALALVCCAPLAACSGTDDLDDPVIARAYDQVLHWSDLRQLVPVGSAPEDSAAMAEAYVNNWLHQQVELHQAELNLAAGQKEFETELRNYRNSLLLFTYEEELVRQRLDTSVNASEVAVYYEANPDRFDLDNDILRARWFHVQGLDKRELKRMKERFLSGDADKMRDVEIELAQRNVTITDGSSRWTTLPELRNEVPVDQLPAVAAEGKRLVLEEEGGAWFLDILELRPRLSPSPIELVHQDIRTILLNQRKLKLIEQMRNDLYREAVDNHEVEIP